MKTLIIGRGEVGTALTQVLNKTYSVELTDRTEAPKDTDIIHICFPYTENFESEVKRYQELYKPKYTVIHSTVPVGICSKLEATHSPIRGIHPHLREGIETFVKFVGGKNADEVADYFRKAGLKVQMCRKSETTELAKILSTTRYGWDIEFAKQTEKECDKYKVPFSEAYNLWTETYNEGYQKLGHKEYTRPILQPLQKKIGGHCICQNLKLLKSKLTKL